MHPNKAFRQVEEEQMLQFADERGFGVLTLAGPNGPLAAHVPFVFSEARDRIRMHLVRSNPIIRHLSEPRPAMMILSGPDAYISPDWYDLADQVPTWNYVAVHLRGELCRLPDEELRSQLEALSGKNEARLLPKPVWTPDKMDEKTLAKMMRMIQPVEMTLEAVEGTWKLGQNKPDAARLNASEALCESAAGMEIGRMKALMAE